MFPLDTCAAAAYFNEGEFSAVGINMRQYEVIVPVRNGGLALINSIQSVLSCSNSGKLLLTLSDNFSTDGSPWKKGAQRRALVRAHFGAMARGERWLRIGKKPMNGPNTEAE